MPENKAPNKSTGAASRNAFGKIRLQLGCEPLHGQVVGQLIADVVQEEEARRGEEGDDRA